VWQGPSPPPSRQEAGDQGPSVARDPPRGSKWADTRVVVIFVVEVGLRLTLAMTGCHPEGRLTRREGSTPARLQARISARTHTHARTHARRSPWFSALARTPLGLPCSPSLARSCSSVRDSCPQPRATPTPAQPHYAHARARAASDARPPPCLRRLRHTPLTRARCCRPARCSLPQLRLPAGSCSLPAAAAKRPLSAARCQPPASSRPHPPSHCYSVRQS
jgi:hypothetical protein